MVLRNRIYCILLHRPIISIQYYYTFILAFNVWATFHFTRSANNNLTYLRTSLIFKNRKFIKLAVSTKLIFLWASLSQHNWINWSRKWLKLATIIWSCRKIMCRKMSCRKSVNLVYWNRELKTFTAHHYE